MKKAHATLAVFTLILLMVGCGGEATQENDSAEETPAVDHGAAKTLTVRNIERIGLAIEQYIMNNHDFGCPKISDIEELDQLLYDLDINVDHSIFADGWGNAMVYEPDMTPGGMEYFIRSYGSDGQPGPEPVTPGIIGKPEEDYIYSVGHWVQRHEGPR